MAANRLFALLICLLAPLSAIADEAALQKELLSLDAQISEVNSTIGRYDGGLIVDLATARREALLLARQLVQNQIAAERGEAKTVSHGLKMDKGRTPQFFCFARVGQGWTPQFRRAPSVSERTDATL